MPVLSLELKSSVYVCANLWLSLVCRIHIILHFYKSQFYKSLLNTPIRFFEINMLVVIFLSLEMPHCFL